MRHTFATSAISVGANITWVARKPGLKSPVVILEKYNRFGPNLTWGGWKGFAAANEMAKHSDPPEKIMGGK